MPWCGRLSPLNMSRLCQTRQPISRTSHSCFPPPLCLSSSLHYYSLYTLPLCLSLLISVLPSVSRSIFHFRFNLFDVFSFLLQRHLSLPFCLPLLPRQSVVPALSLSHEVNMPLHVVVTCQSSYDSQQNVPSCGHCVCVLVWGFFRVQLIVVSVVNKISEIKCSCTSWYPDFRTDASFILTCSTHLYKM